YRDDVGGGGRTSKGRCDPATDLLSPLSRLADRSRPSTPEGSLPAFAWGDVARRLNPCPADYRPAFASSLLLYPQPRRLILRPPSPEGRATGLPCSVSIPERVRSRLWAGGATSVAGERFRPCAWPLTFWFKPVSIFGLSNITAFNNASAGLTIPLAP